MKSLIKLNKKIRPCKRCKKPIYYAPDARNWIAKNASGDTHKCNVKKGKK